MTTINENIEVEEFDCQICGSSAPVESMQMFDNSYEYLESCYECWEDNAMYCVQCDEVFTSSCIEFCDCNEAYCAYCHEYERYCCGSTPNR